MTSNTVILSNPPNNGTLWLKQGFQLFKASPGAWIGTTLLYILISACVSIVPIIGSLLSPMISAVMMGGLMLGCQAQTQGSPFKVDYLFSAFSKQYLALVRLGLIYVGLILLMFIPFFIITAGMDIENLSAQETPVFMLVMLVGAALAVPVAMGYWLAPALIVCRQMDAWPAFVLSFRGCLKNILPALIYGLLIVFWALIATIPALLGWLILIPTLVASTFAAYQNIFKTENNLV